MSYTNLLYHIVFATKERAPLITGAIRLRLHEYLGGTNLAIGEMQKGKTREKRRMRLHYACKWE